MPAATESIRFCTSRDGARLAFRATGSGPHLLLLPAQNSDLDLAEPGPATRHWLQALEPHFRVLRMDPRGCGLSQREMGEFALERWLEDIDAVLDAAGVDRAGVVAISNGCVAAIEYAVTRADRVDRIFFYGGYARGRLQRDLTEEARRGVLLALELMPTAWKDQSVTGQQYRMHFYRQHFPFASPQTLAAIEQVCAMRISVEAATRYPRITFQRDASDAASRIRCPVLVMHARRDQHCPVQEGARLASLIAGARLLEVDSDNHMPLADEAGWPTVRDELLSFFGAPHAQTQVRRPALTVRQREVLRLVSHGRTDKQVARELGLSPRTVEMHVAAALSALGCATRAEAVHRAMELHLLAEQPSNAGAGRT